MSATPENVFGYAPAIWRRFTRVRHAGVFPSGERGVIAAEAGTPAARSVLRLELQLAGGRIADARFRAYGCPTAIAVGEWLAEQAIGRNAKDLAGIDAAQIRAALEIPDDRAHCALMGEDVIKALLAQSGM